MSAEKMNEWAVKNEEGIKGERNLPHIIIMIKMSVIELVVILMADDLKVCSMSIWVTDGIRFG